MKTYTPSTVVIRNKTQAKKISKFFDQHHPESKGAYKFLVEEEYPLLVYAGNSSYSSHSDGWDIDNYKEVPVTLKDFLQNNEEKPHDNK